jgi:hypothetical protein
MDEPVRIELKCREFGSLPGCLGTIDEKYTMRFDDIGEEPIYFCSHCGPINHALQKVFDKAFEDPETRSKLEEAITKAEAESHLKRS